MRSSARNVDPRLPLALLRAVRQQDTPAEWLPDEKPTSSFPHRLGLSDVVQDQIREFRRLAQRRWRVEQSRVEALLELIARRPDATEIFAAAGRTLASLHFSGPSAVLRRSARRFPKPIRRRAALRALRAAAAAFLVAEETEVMASPLAIRATDALTARVGDAGIACSLYSSLAAGLLEMSGVEPAEVVHAECQARGADRCLWKHEPGEPGAARA